MNKQYFDIDHIDKLIPIAKLITEGFYPKTVVLQGDLGSGKTTFVRTFMVLHDPAVIIASPTFTLMNIYETDCLTVHHFDLYRLNSVEEVWEWGFEEFVKDCDFSFVEWAERAWELIPKPYTLINIKHGKTPEERSLTIEEVPF